MSAFHHLQTFAVAKGMPLADGRLDWFRLHSIRKRLPASDQKALSRPMQRRLHKHRDDLSSPIENIVVDAYRFEDGCVLFDFLAAGDVSRVALPAPNDPGIGHELWRHTCFESFIATEQGGPYFELNFSPSGEWAAYRFDRYRSGMEQVGIGTPELKINVLGPMITVTATVALGPLPELVPWQTWHIGLSAVIETAQGSRSHWALAHPFGKPDFHHEDCFAAELAPDASL